MQNVYIYNQHKKSGVAKLMSDKVGSRYGVLPKILGKF